MLTAACATLLFAPDASPGEPAPDPVCAAEVTRNAGWFMYRPAALDACLAGGPLRFGRWQVKSSEDALRLLWGESLDDARHRLARSLLVARCNQRLFHARPRPADLLVDAERALDGLSCAPLPLLTRRVDAWNETGWRRPLPSGFNPPAVTQSAIARVVTGQKGPTSPVCTMENPTHPR